MEKNLYLLILICIANVIYAQTMETEPNSSGEAGIIVITQNGEFTGQNCRTDSDYWHLPYGSSGTLTVNVNYGEEVLFIAVWSSEEGYLGTGETKGHVTSGSPLTFSYGVTEYVALIVEPENMDGGEVLKPYSFTLSGGALPVELTSFSAIEHDDQISLIWETATEVNNYGFEIERKSEISNWKKIGFLEGNGNSNISNTYKYNDYDKLEIDKYYYRLKQIDTDGNYSYSKEIELDLSNIEIGKFELSQNFPNPFNPSTMINYSLPENSYVSIKIYDLLGKEVSSLINKEKQKGKHEIEFDGSFLSSGIYYYAITAGNYVDTKKMILVK